MIRCIPVPTCAQCPHRQRHYGQFECAAFNFQELPDGDRIPEWCPLPPHPSFSDMVLAASQAAEGERNHG